MTTLKLGLAGPDPLAIFRATREAFLGDAGLPTSLYVDGKKKVTADWLEKWSTRCSDFLAAEWEGRGRLRLDPGTIVKLSLESYDLDPRRVMDALRDVPFTVCSTATTHPEWQSGALGEKYLAPSFGDMHWNHGWGCLFRGEGHKRLVSRRWLEFGPWRLLRGADDTSLVQFHDLAADAATALAQAKPGHERMGISAIGGYLQTHFHYAHDVRGMYYGADKSLHIVVPAGAEVSQRDMLDACAARRDQVLGPEQPIERVVYVFVEEAPARAAVPELWLRELGCRAFVDGVEQDLAATYHPTPDKPAWVAHVEAQG